MSKRYTCKEIAEIYGVAVATVWRWIRKGHLVAIELNSGNCDKYRIREEDLLAFETSRLTVQEVDNAKPN